jgi:hypothetical protein
VVASVGWRGGDGVGHCKSISRTVEEHALMENPFESRPCLCVTALTVVSLRCNSHVLTRVLVVSCRSRAGKSRLRGPARPVSSRTMV